MFGCGASGSWPPGHTVPTCDKVWYMSRLIEKNLFGRKAVMGSTAEDVSFRGLRGQSWQMRPSCPMDPAESHEGIELTLILQQLSKRFVLRGKPMLLAFWTGWWGIQEQQNIFLGGIIKMSLVGKCKWKLAQYPSLPSFYRERENRILMKTCAVQLIKAHTWHEFTFRDFFIDDHRFYTLKNLKMSPILNWLWVLWFQNSLKKSLTHD